VKILIRSRVRISGAAWLLRRRGPGPKSKGQGPGSGRAGKLRGGIFSSLLVVDGVGVEGERQIGDHAAGVGDAGDVRNINNGVRGGGKRKVQIGQPRAIAGEGAGESPWWTYPWLS